MFTRHVSQQLAAHLDGCLAQPKAQHVERHLRQCPRCQAECEQVRQGMAMVEHLPPVEAPEAIWWSIEAAFAENRSTRTPAVLRWRWAFAATVVLGLAGAAYWRLAHPPA